MASLAPNTFDFIAKDCIEHPVCGSPQNFYPVSVGTMFRLRGVAQALGAAFAVLFADQSRDTGSRREEVLDEGSVVATNLNVEAISPSLAEYRTNSRRGAIQSVIEAIMSESGMSVVAELVMDSMRDKFPPNASKSKEAIKEFTDSVTPAATYDMLVGLAKANKGMFGPLGEKMASLLGRVEEALAKVTDPTQTSGQSFKIRSYGSPSGDTAPTSSSASPSGSSTPSTSPATDSTTKASPSN